MTKETKKKNLFWFLTIFTFLVLIISWQFFLKNFSPKKEKENRFIKDLINQEGFIKESFDKLLYNLKEMKFINFPPEKESKEKLTNEELEKLKEKIFQQINQELINK